MAIPGTGSVEKDTHFSMNVGASFYAGPGKDYVTVNSINTACYLEAKLLMDNKNFEIEFPQQQWVHVTSVHDGTTTKLYINGALVQQTTTASCYKYPKTGHYSPLYIGTSGAGWIDGTNTFGTYGTDGKIDEVYIFKRALTDNDIKALYVSKN